VLISDEEVMAMRDSDGGRLGWRSGVQTPELR
jgi:hypothetical protein